MKKRLLSVLLVLILLMTAIPSVSANSNLCFVAMNDTIPVILKGSAAPYYTSGKLYLPYTAFNASPNGVGATYNVEKNTFVLFNANDTLIFDLENDTYKDKRNKEYTVDVAYKSGLLYVPAKVASHFDLSVTLLTSRQGYPIIRFTNGAQVYDDGTFVAQAENLINRAAQEYQQELAAQNTGPDTSIMKPEEEIVEERGPIEVYLAFRGDAVSQDTLKKLAEREIRAAFFVTEEQILLERDLIRAIYAAGHTIGLCADETVGDREAAIIRANDALDTVIFCRSILAMTPAGTTLDLASVHTLQEPVSKTVEELLETANEPQLYVVSSGSLGVIASLVNAGATMLKLRETSFS